MNLKKLLLIIGAGLLIAGILPIASSYIPLPFIPVTVTSIQDGSEFDQELVAYFNSGATCTDLDNGMNVTTFSHANFDDLDTGFSWGMDEFCLNDSTLIEFGCSQDVLLNGADFKDLTFATAVDCKAIGFNQCRAGTCE